MRLILNIFLFLLVKIENTALVENCFQELRNVINVFQAGSIFEKLSNETQRDVWNDTWNILSDVTPQLKQELASNQENTEAQNENETQNANEMIQQVPPQINQ